MHISDKEHSSFKSHFSFIETKKKIEIVKPDLDKNEYRYIELDNKMKVLLISDPLTSIASGSLDVKAGSWDEPKEFGGLAHFLEHMEF